MVLSDCSERVTTCNTADLQQYVNVLTITTKVPYSLKQAACFMATAQVFRPSE